MMERTPSSLAAALPISVVDGRRNWASGRAPSLIERVAAWTGGVGAPYPLFRIRATVIDADVLIKETLASERRGYPVALMELAELGVLRMYAAQAVIAEVNEGLARAAVEADVAPVAAVALWRGLRDRIRVVDVPEALAETANLRDPKDAPTAYLSRAVGQAWTWSNDRDLRDVALARVYELELALKIREAGAQERELYTTVSAGVTGIELAARAVQAIWTLAARYPVVAFALGAGLAIALERLVTHRASVGAFINETWTAAAPSRARAAARLERYAQVIADCPPAPAPDAALPLPLAIARVLAGAPVPLSIEEIASRLHASSPASEAAIRAAVRCRMFVRTGVGRWQLGWW